MHCRRSRRSRGPRGPCGLPPGRAAGAHRALGPGGEPVRRNRPGGHDGPAQREVRPSARTFRDRRPPPVRAGVEPHGGAGHHRQLGDRAPVHLHHRGPHVRESHRARGPARAHDRRRRAGLGVHGPGHLPGRAHGLRGRRARRTGSTSSTSHPGRSGASSTAPWSRRTRTTASATSGTWSSAGTAPGCMPWTRCTSVWSSWTPRRRRVVHSVPVGRYPFGVALSPDETKVYVANVGMFEYRKIPGTDEEKPESGLEYPAFGFGTREMREGVTVEGKPVPGLGDPNAPESFSVWTVSLDPDGPRVTSRVKTGTLVGEPVEGIPAVGGSSPNSLVATSRHVFVSNGNNDTVSVLDLRSNEILTEIRLRPFEAVRQFRGVIPFGLAVSPDETRSVRGRGRHQRRGGRRHPHVDRDRPHPRGLVPREAGGEPRRRQADRGQRQGLRQRTQRRAGLRGRPGGHLHREPDEGDRHGAGHPVRLRAAGTHPGSPGEQLPGGSGGLGPVRRALREPDPALRGRKAVTDQAHRLRVQGEPDLRRGLRAGGRGRGRPIPRALRARRDVHQRRRDRDGRGRRRHAQPPRAGRALRHRRQLLRRLRRVRRRSPLAGEHLPQRVGRGHHPRLLRRQPDLRPGVDRARQPGHERGGRRHLPRGLQRGGLPVGPPRPARRRLLQLRVRHHVRAGHLPRVLQVHRDPPLRQLPGPGPDVRPDLEDLPDLQHGDPRPVPGGPVHPGVPKRSGRTEAFRRC